eukprot:CAMPEP_0113953318 /NCGR_PEP_ID=MMETSP1339-20121228/90913_1 /TAXON_ID=94617 /ORGANISM="Fibrocapsa japonica" /LENGTH=555 /DNA_ID=CAMNT_0000962041 /DNA_START=27 /DNA_END=1691 /DNA_ORIENTATION=+ /assembly_acc=CAM_ASM_000762
MRSAANLVHVAISTALQMGPFLAVFFTVIIGFSITMSGQFSGVEGYSNLPQAALNLFGSALGNFDYGVFMEDETDWEAVAILTLFLLVAMIMLLNMLIALLSDIYAAVQGSALEESESAHWSFLKERECNDEWSLPGPLAAMTIIIWTVGASLDWMTQKALPKLMKMHLGCIPTGNSTNGGNTTGYDSFTDGNITTGNSINGENTTDSNATSDNLWSLPEKRLVSHGLRLMVDIPINLLAVFLLVLFRQIKYAFFLLKKFEEEYSLMLESKGSWALLCFYGRSLHEIFGQESRWFGGKKLKVAQGSDLMKIPPRDRWEKEYREKKEKDQDSQTKIKEENLVNFLNRLHLCRHLLALAFCVLGPLALAVYIPVACCQNTWKKMKEGLVSKDGEGSEGQHEGGEGDGEEEHKGGEEERKSGEGELKSKEAESKAEEEKLKAEVYQKMIESLKKLEPRDAKDILVEMKTSHASEQAAMKESMEERFTSFATEQAAMNEKLSSMEDRFSSMETAQEERFSKMENMLSSILAHVSTGGEATEPAPAPAPVPAPATGVDMW